MSSVGSYLRELRERRGLPLEEIARVTRVGRPYLEAIEAGRFEALPAPVFTRGFIRAYCEVLGEPPSEALARFESRGSDAGAASAAARAAAAVPALREPRGRGPVFVSFLLFVVLGVALFAVTLVLQSGREVRHERRLELLRGDRGPAEPVAAARPMTPSDDPVASQPGGSPPASDVAAVPSGPPARDDAASTRERPALPSTPPGASVSPPIAVPERSVPAAPAAAPTPPRVGETESGRGQMSTARAAGRTTAPYRLIARTNQPTWIRVRTEDGHSSEETIPAGQTREWISNRRFTVAIGNAGGVSLELNGVALPSLGANGAVIPKLVLPSDEP